MAKYQIQQELVTVFFFIGDDGVKQEFLTEQAALEAATQAEFAAEIDLEVTAYLNANKLFGRRRAGADTQARSISAFLKTYKGEVYEFDHEAAAEAAKAEADAAKAAEAAKSGETAPEAPADEAGAAEELG